MYRTHRNLVGSRSCIDIEYVFNYTINKDKIIQKFQKNFVLIFILILQSFLLRLHLKISAQTFHVKIL